MAPIFRIKPSSLVSLRVEPPLKKDRSFFYTLSGSKEEISFESSYQDPSNQLKCHLNYCYKEILAIADQAIDSS